MESEYVAQFTPYSDVNAVLRHFLGEIRAILGGCFVGMYVYGSLAQGDFDHGSSDIDFIVVTAREVTEREFGLLERMHRAFRAGDSSWAEEIEAAYIQKEALNLPGSRSGRYPQLEKGREFAWEPLEDGWPFQRAVLREQGIVVAGPDPATLMEPVAARELAAADMAIVRAWQEQRRSDPTWLDWVRERSAQRFFLVTLCRVLYRIAHGTLASKMVAARWAQETLDERWAALIARAVAARDDRENVSDRELAETLAFLDFAAERLAQSPTNALASLRKGKASG